MVMKQILSLSLLLALSAQAEWSVKPASNPKAVAESLPSLVRYLSRGRVACVVQANKRRNIIEINGPILEMLMPGLRLRKLELPI